MKQYNTFRLNRRVLTALLFAMALLSPVVVSAADKATKGDLARGARAWSEHCTRCHNVRDPRELRDDQWISTTYHMRVRAGLTGQETRDILTFLQKSN